MAYVSYGLNKGNEAASSPIEIAIGSDDGGAGNDVTLCFNQAVHLTTKDVILICEAFIRRLEDSNYGPTDVLNI